MAWWLFQMNQNKIFDNGLSYTVQDLKKAIEAGHQDWGWFHDNYLNVSVGDDVLIRTAKDKNKRYSSVVLAQAKVTKIPADYEDYFRLEFRKEESEKLMANPINDEQLRPFLKHPEAPKNKTIQPLSDETGELMQSHLGTEAM